MESEAKKQSVEALDDDAPIDDDDNPEWTEEDFARAKPIDEIPELADLAAFLRAGGRIGLPEKYSKAVTVLLDDKVIEHFKVGEDGWMERVNAALRKAAGL
jgi:uncharacterized protein (DUF4415 family)